MDYTSLRRTRLEKIKGRYVPGSSLKVFTAPPLDSAVSLGHKLMTLEDDNALEILEYHELVNGTDDAIIFENGIFEIRNELYDNGPFVPDEGMKAVFDEAMGNDDANEERNTAAGTVRIDFPETSGERALYLSSLLRETASPFAALLREDDRSLKSIYSVGFTSGKGNPVFDFDPESDLYKEIFSPRRTLLFNETPERLSELWETVPEADLGRIYGCCFVPLGNITGGDYLFFAFAPSLIQGEKVLSILKKLNNIPDFA